MKFSGPRPSTAGERLYYFITKDIVGYECAIELSESAVTRYGGRTHDFAQYFFGFAIANIFARLIKKTERVLTEEHSDHHKIVTQYIERSLEAGIFGNRAVIRRMASLAIDAVKVSGKTIPSSVEKAVSGDRRRMSCYLCGTDVYRGASVDSEKLEYEHIWPSSYGGDSIAENLLPACWPCNKAKSDMILWHSANVAGFCLKPEPSEEEMKCVQRREKIAAHLRTIHDHASRFSLTLKESALRVGPIKITKQSSIDPDDARDFFNLSFE